MGQELRSDLLGWFWLWGLQGALQVVLLSSEGLTGAGGPVSEVAHSRGWGLGANCWQEASVLCQRYLSRVLPGCPYDMAAGFLQNQWPKRGQSGSCNVLYDPVLEVTHSHCCNIPLVTHRSVLIPYGKGLHRNENTRWWTLWYGKHQELGDHSYLLPVVWVT